MLEALEQLKRDVAILMVKDEKRANQIREHQKEIVSLKNRVKLLSQSSDGYLSIRETLRRWKDSKAQRRLTRET